MNRPETLKKTLESITGHNFIPKQIVIVDQSEKNDVIQENKRILNEISKKGIQTVHFYQEKPSLTAARNNAIKFATEEIIICSDDDIEVYDDTLLNISNKMKDKSISMIAAIDDNMPTKQSALGYILGTRSFKKRKIGHVTYSMLGRYPENVKGEVKTEWAMGCFFVIRKSLMVLWKIKWDEQLTSYAYPEDLDFSYSYYKLSEFNGLHCILDENIRIKHMVSNEYRVPSRKSTYMYVINRRYLSYKHNMGFNSRLAMCWCDFWRFAERFIKNEQPFDIIRAYMICKKEAKKMLKQ